VQSATRVESLAAIIREATISEHRDAESRPFIRHLMGGELSLAEYTRYLAQFAWIYETLESRAAMPEDPSFFDPALVRFARIEHDLVALGVGDWRSEHPQLGATSAYVDRLGDLPAGDIPRWAAHHYTRYLGDLSGGQAIARLVSRNYGAEPGQLTFFDFSTLGDLVPYKRAYREGLDALILRDDDVDVLVCEVRLAYALNGALFDGLAA
jgi:heme oxygenase